jgi:hypothetical protein
MNQGVGVRAGQRIRNVTDDFNWSRPGQWSRCGKEFAEVSVSISCMSMNSRW